MNETQKERSRLGVKSGVTGICCNVLLSILKYLAGRLSGSVSMTADAANNLSDAASSLVTAIGSLLSGKPVDREHPFGHGRMEYVSALVVAFLILHTGFDLVRDSFGRILHPAALEFRLLSALIPAFSICVKLGMALLNHIFYRKTGNLNLKTVRQDSLMDCAATGGVLLAQLHSLWYAVPWLDGAIGLGVSVLVILSGVGLVRDILGPLLGQAPPAELTDHIERILLEEPLISGVHDLIVHDYGPGHTLASVHAEMPAEESVLLLHDAIDRAEKRIEAETEVSICIHIDPVRSHDTASEHYRALTERVLRELNEAYSFHDLHCTEEETGVSLRFELVIPFSEKDSGEHIAEEVRERLHERDERVSAEIVVEHSYI